MTERLFHNLSEERKKEISENIRAVKAGIDDAVRAGGRGKSVTLLAATKTVPAEQINYATQVCGITDIVENRVQELLSKYDDLIKDNVKIHFIGQLQTNKVKYIVDKVDMIHSVDSEKLAREINRQAQKHGKIMEVLVEINIGREENKGGVMPEQAGELADLIDELDHLKLAGIMTIAPISEENEKKLQFFSETYQIYLDICEKKRHNRDRYILSMGMSDSYPQAIACGSDLVRVGSALFGARPKAVQ